MQLELLTGSGGSGKTTTLLNEAKERWLNAGTPTWILVPDSATFVTEKRILTSLGDRVGNGIRVFSMNRLAHFILSETGNARQFFMDTSGKSILLYRIIRALQDQLPLFSDAIRRGGFTKAAGETIAEFKRYQVSPEQLKDAAAKTENMRLRAKLSELALIHEAYDSSMASKAFWDGDDRLRMASEQMTNLPVLHGVAVSVDQFLSFSPAQVQFILSLQQVVAGMTLTVGTCGSGAEENPSLPQGYQGIVPLLKAQTIKAGGIVLERELPAMDYRHRAGSGLCHLSQTLQRAKATPFNGKTDDIRLFANKNPEEEVHICARSIVALCRDKGVRYKSIAVLVPDMEVYTTGVRRIFAMHDIPLFMDKKESLASNPVTVLLLTVFDILRGGWRHDDVFRLLKTGLLPFQRDEIDRFENAALATGFRGKKAWTEMRLDVKELEDIRKALVPPLLAFRSVMHGTVAMEDALKAYFNLLMQWQLPQTIAGLSVQLEKDGHLAQAAHMRQIWRSACDLMDQMMTLAADQPVSLTAFHGMLQTGLESGETGVIPPSLEEVFVGTSGRTRLAEIDYLFALGFVDGWVPMAGGGQGIFSDAERRSLTGLSVTLAPDDRTAMQERREELACLLTMPGKGLTVSRPVSDAEGKSVLPSPFLTELAVLFPQLKETSPVFFSLDCVTTPKATLDILVPQLKPEDVLAQRRSGSSPEPVPAGQISFFIQEQPQAGTEALPAERGSSPSPEPVPAGQISLFIQDQNQAGTEAEPAKSLAALLFDSLNQLPEAQNACDKIRESLLWENTATLSPAWMKARYGDRFHGSVSSLEQFRKCPFSWYAGHVLSLEERKEIGLRDIGFGLLMHDAVDSLFDLIDAAGGWEAIEEDAIPALSQKAVTQAIGKGIGISPLHPGLRRWFVQRLQAAAEIAGHRVFQQIRGGLYRPLGHEIIFGREGAYPPLNLNLQDNRTMELQGRLDRLDVYRADAKAYFRVVDYKSGDKTLSLSDIKNGLSLQLPAYLSVVLQHEAASYGPDNAQAAGLFHMRLEPPDIRQKTASEASAETERNKHFRLTGIFLDEPEVVRAMDAQWGQGEASTLVKARFNKDGKLSASTNALSAKGFAALVEQTKSVIEKLGSKMVNGEIPVWPIRTTTNQKACDFCPYIRVCRFEPGVGGNCWDMVPSGDENKLRESLEQCEPATPAGDENKLRESLEQGEPATSAGDENKLRESLEQGEPATPAGDENKLRESLEQGEPATPAGDENKP